MMRFEEFCNQSSALTAEAVEDLKSALKTATVKKGHYLLKSGRVCRYLYFINSGFCKTHFFKGEKEFIMRFFPEGSMFTVLDSFTQQIPATYSIYTLEPTTYTAISYASLEALCKKHHCLETFFRKLNAAASVNMMKRITELLEDNASERYQDFLKEQAHLLQRISLGDLASYLGITQVSLSRIRAVK